MIQVIPARAAPIPTLRHADGQGEAIVRSYWKDLTFPNAEPRWRDSRRDQWIHARAPEDRAKCLEPATLLLRQLKFGGSLKSRYTQNLGTRYASLRTIRRRKANAKDEPWEKAGDPRCIRGRFAVRAKERDGITAKKTPVRARFAPNHSIFSEMGVGGCPLWELSRDDRWPLKRARPQQKIFMVLLVLNMFLGIRGWMTGPVAPGRFPRCWRSGDPSKIAPGPSYAMIFVEKSCRSTIGSRFPRAYADPSPPRKSTWGVSTSGGSSHRLAAECSPKYRRVVPKFWQLAGWLSLRRIH